MVKYQSLMCDDAGGCCIFAGNFRGVCPILNRATAFYEIVAISCRACNRESFSALVNAEKRIPLLYGKKRNTRYRVKMQFERQSHRGCCRGTLTRGQCPWKKHNSKGGKPSGSNGENQNQTEEL